RTLMHRRMEVALVPVVIDRVKRQVLVIRTIAQMAVDRRRIDDLAGIHQVPGIEESLDPFKSAVYGVAVKTPQIPAAHDAVAVLAAPRSLVGDHAFEDLVRDLLEMFDVASVAQVEDRLDVDHADAGVRVIIDA